MDKYPRDGLTAFVGFASKAGKCDISFADKKRGTVLTVSSCRIEAVDYAKVTFTVHRQTGKPLKRFPNLLPS